MTGRHRQATRIAAEAYSDGEFAHIASLGDEQEMKEASREVGDTLFSFLMVELSMREGCEGLEEAVKRIGTSLRELEAVKAALEAAIAAEKESRPPGRMVAEDEEG